MLLLVLVPVSPLSPGICAAAVEASMPGGAWLEQGDLLLPGSTEQEQGMCRKLLPCTNRFLPGIYQGSVLLVLLPVVVALNRWGQWGRGDRQRRTADFIVLPS